MVWEAAVAPRVFRLADGSWAATLCVTALRTVCSAPLEGRGACGTFGCLCGNDSTVVRVASPEETGEFWRACAEWAGAQPQERA